VTIRRLTEPRKAALALTEGEREPKHDSRPAMAEAGQQV
jgi:hypothetical protein